MVARQHGRRQLGPLEFLGLHQGLHQKLTNLAKHGQRGTQGRVPGRKSQAKRPMT
jgi:hypothetical protein